MTGFPTGSGRNKRFMISTRLTGEQMMFVEKQAEDWQLSASKTIAVIISAYEASLLTNEAVVRDGN